MFQNYQGRSLQRCSSQRMNQREQIKIQLLKKLNRAQQNQACANKWKILCIQKKSSLTVSFWWRVFRPYSQASTGIVTVLSMWKSIVVISCMQTECQAAANHVKEPGLWVCYHPHPPFVIITQPESWYSFYRPTEGGRLSWPRHCRKGMQPVPKAVYCSGGRDKHNCRRWDLNLGPLTLQSGVLPLD